MSQDLIKMEQQYGAHNYHPLPVVYSKAKGSKVWDVDGKEYYDFLSCYSAVNQGHGHPKIIEALVKQAEKCCLSSRAFYNDVFPQFAKYITEYFGFDMVLPMNTGAEGVETAVKLARRWGYDVKKIPEGQAVLIACSANFHGRTLSIVSFSTDPDSRGGFGPYTPGMEVVEYGSVKALEEMLEKNGKVVCGFLVEPIQGEAGIVVPPEGYLRECKALCEKHNVLFIADEIQSGLCRSGRMLAVDWDGVKPDVLILGKALSGGVYPVSCVLANKSVMLVIKPGQHGSTYGGNPLGCAVAMAALQVLKDEKLAERADKLGQRFRDAIAALKSPLISEIRGRGMLNAIVIEGPGLGDKSAWDICLLMAHRGLLAKPTHDKIIRLAPPLVMTEAEMDECVAIIKGALEDVVKMKKEDIPLQGM